MATFTRTITEASADPSGAKSTWTITVSGGQNIVSGSVFTIPFPTVQAKYSAYGSKNAARILVNLIMAFGNTDVRGFAEYTNNDRFSFMSWPANTNKTLVLGGHGPYEVYADEIFTSDNPTTRTINVNWSLDDVSGGSCYTTEGRTPVGYLSSGAINLGTAYTLTLNAPPSFVASPLTVTSPSVDTYYAGYSNASVEVNDLIAKCGGTITSIAFIIGNATVTRADAGVLTMPLNEAGTFTPTIRVTDSRGQTKDFTYDPIVVEPVTRFLNVESLDRIDGVYRLTDDREIISGKSYYVMSNDGTKLHPHQFTAVTITPDDSRNPRVEGWYEDSGNDFSALADEGQSALITAKITYVPEIADLEEPIIQVNDETDPDANPYITWYYDRALTDPVDWTDTSSLEDSEITIYGYIDNMFDTDLSYKVLVIPVDSEGQGTGILQTLYPAFYTVDFKAGGHGIAFGMPAKEEGFHCGMDAHFYNMEGSDGVVSVHLEPRNDYDWNIDHAPANNAYGTGFEIYDSAGHRIANLDAHAYPNGAIATVLGVHRLVNNSHVYHQIFLYIDADGTTRYGISNGAAFRDAIGLKSSQTTPTNTDSSVWQSGAINIYKRGNVVTVKVNGVTFGATSARTEFATIPEGYRPITETGGMFDSSNVWFFCRPNGTIAINQAAAGQRWGAITYLIDV